jgi:hypothetical protein
MNRITRAAAVLAAVASLGAVAAAPATAATADPGPEIPLVCYNDINVPSCVNWAFDVVSRTVTYAQETVVPTAQWGANTAACAALEITTGRDCPYWPVTSPPIN